MNKNIKVVIILLAGVSLMVTYRNLSESRVKINVYADKQELSPGDTLHFEARFINRAIRTVNIENIASSCRTRLASDPPRSIGSREVASVRGLIIVPEIEGQFEDMIVALSDANEKFAVGKVQYTVVAN